MEKYNQNLQYTLALDAVCNNIESKIQTFDEFNSISLLTDATLEHTRFIASVDEDKLFLTECILIGLN